jgi:hypothetical protein
VDAGYKAVRKASVVKKLRKQGTHPSWQGLLHTWGVLRVKLEFWLCPSFTPLYSVQEFGCCESQLRNTRAAVALAVISASTHANRHIENHATYPPH